MKKIIFISLLVLINNQNTKACDVCGCGIGSGFSNILPQFNKNFIGLRSSYARNNSHHIDDFQNISKEKTVSVELWGRFYLNKKLQLITVLPYNIKSQKEDGLTKMTNGLGDASLSLNYTLIKINADSLKWKHLLLAGGGVKLPTGRSTVPKDNPDQSVYLQPGSGSLDYLFNVLYTLRLKKIGVSNDVQYRVTNQNKNRYAFGNKLSINSRLFYWINYKKSCNVLPFAGILVEKMDKDLLGGVIQKETGGYLCGLSMGGELYYKQFLMSFNYSYPVRQNLANGNVQALSRIQFNTSFLF